MNTEIHAARHALLQEVTPARSECEQTLLRGIPPMGGIVNREGLEMLVRSAFDAGAVAGAQSSRRVVVVSDFQHTTS